MNNNNTIIQETSGLNAFYSRVYAFVGLGIGVSALVAGLMLTVLQNTLFTIATTSSWLVYGSIIAELILVFWASGLAMKNSPSALPVFLGYSALNGFTISFIVARYTQGTVLSAFISSSVLFFVMAAMGRVVKKDLSGMGRALIAALWGIIIASIVNFFMASSAFDFMLSIVTVLVFAGLTAWDNQKIRYVYEQAGGNVSNGWAVSLALSLYLDFINLFLSLLRIFGRND
ncbi:Bax inhibitor-1/YccA family protein [Streptococcus massiliensis]|uniref:Integral membrane protein, receptor n=1 Tax=Streptococcus massiliensis TaxID=313439 RepID=A0A380KYK8_9STRE|nr:Bax inhibitor-1/YccA family protein [Streptococcus massiliensis]SUN76715.1 integral membrane protein, receptor [Streptococcus massiliensis]